MMTEGTPILGNLHICFGWWQIMKYHVWLCKSFLFDGYIYTNLIFDGYVN